MLKSPIRYPGGKSKSIKFLKDFIPSFDELREPFFGGGSFSIFCAQQHPNKIFKVSDLNYELYCFWAHLKNDPHNLIEQIRNIRDEYQDGKKLYSEIIDRRNTNLSEQQRAIDFFILNRISFSGLADCGGYSDESFHKRFTKSSVIRLEKIVPVISKINFHCEDFSYLINQPGENVFLFLDPPYFSVKKSRLYGKKGLLHLEFDHDRLFHNLKECSHRWMMSYDDSDYIRGLYRDFHILPWQHQYGMNNYKQTSAAKGNELLISNFALKRNDT